MTKMRMIPRLAAVAAAALIAIAAFGASALAQPAPPHQLYGGGLAEGDVVAFGDAWATADADGNWGIQTTAGAAAEADENSFTVNGQAATAVMTAQGDSLTHVALTVTMMEDDSMMDDDSMMEDDSMMDEDGEMMEDDSMMDDDDSMMEDDAMLDEETGFPETGSGGLADGGLSAGLIGLLIALGAAAIAGLGLRRIRTRA